MQSFKEIYISPSEDHNFALIVENQKVWTSKDILAMFSPVLKKMIYGEFKERNQDFVELPDKKVDDVVELISCLCCYPIPKEIDAENINIMLGFADEYDIVMLKVRLMHPDQCNKNTQQQMESGFQLAYECNDKLKKLCSDSVIEMINSLKSFHKFLPLLKLALVYRNKGIIKSCIVRMAMFSQACEIKINRAQLTANVVGAIYEAKTFRAELERDRHNPEDRYSSEDKCSYCEKEKTRTYCFHCKRKFCYNCDSKFKLICNWSHDKSCQYKDTKNQYTDCQCGYQFEDAWLSEL